MSQITSQTRVLSKALITDETVVTDVMTGTVSETGMEGHCHVPACLYVSVFGGVIYNDVYKGAITDGLIYTDIYIRRMDM
jgi:hypothetical protein